MITNRHAREHKHQRLLSFLVRGFPLGLAGLVVLASCAAVRSTTRVLAAPAVTGLHVVGNQIVNGTGQPLRLLGVNRSGTEYQCVHGYGIFDGPSDAASVQAIAVWHTNAVRVPLNEDCWLGINGVNPAYAGAAYQQAIASYVGLLNSYGLIAILDLHWVAPGANQAVDQQPLPDADHASAYWGSVAAAFKGNSSVVFDLYTGSRASARRCASRMRQRWCVAQATDYSCCPR